MKEDEFMPVRVPIQLKRCAATEIPEEFEAWYLPTATAAEWVEECSRWPCDQESMSFFPLPCSRNNRSIDGAIVCLEKNTVPAKIPGRGTGLVMTHRKILTPAGYTLSVPMSRREIEEQIPHELSVFLPPRRWFTFDKGEGLGFHDLLESLPEKGTRWNRAVPANESLPRLTALKARDLPGPDEMMAEWGDGIGSNDPAEMPGSDQRRERGKEARERFYEQILRFTESRPVGEGTAPTWVNRLEDWARQRLSQIGQQSGELERLVDLLKKDPDQGLRFAMPLSDELPRGRGVGPPGDSLPRRNSIQFNLSNLFGSGQAISPWMIDNDRYLELQRSYREAANRELNLRRYRRAAYIFGELLGDMSSAANALEQGRHYAEAAVLYEKKLNDRRSAARAFHKGGIFEEAIRLYRELEEYGEVGQLLRDLGRIDEAERAFREAVQSCLFRDKRLEAARIAERDLEDPEYALTIYHEAWPDHFSAGECLRREIELLGSLRGNDAVMELLRSLSVQKWKESQSLVLLQQLVHSKYQYPNERVAALADDLARVVVSLQLCDPQSDKAALLGVMSEIDPSDRLLRHDANRFRKKKARIPGIPPASPALRKDHSVTLVAKCERDHHPAESRAIAACAWQGNAVVATVSPQKQHSIVVSNHEEGVIGALSLREDESLQETVRLLVMQSRLKAGDQNVVVMDEAGTDLPFRMVPGQGDLWIGNSELFQKALGFTSTESGQTWKVLKNGEGEVYLESSYRGNILETYPLGSISQQMFAGISAIPMVASRSSIYLGIGNYLVRWQNNSLAELALPFPILDLAATLYAGRSRVAIGMERGFAVAWGDPDWSRHNDSIPHQVYDEDLQNGRVGFTGSGHLIVAGESCMAVFSVGKMNLTRHGGYAMPRPGKVHAVVPTNTPDAFEVVTSRAIIGIELRRAEQS